ncbi:hypothetical protein BJX70DRAFT_188341 [Aspergillus crustosus]
MAMRSLSLCSIQALLILAMSFWGEGRWVEYGNLIAMCKRMSHQLNIAATSGPSREPPLKTSLGSLESFAITEDIDNEEQIRTYWMMEILDSVFALNVGSDISASPSPLAPKFPCSDTIWASPGLFGREIPSYLGLNKSGFSLCINVCVLDLKAVRRFQRSVLQSSNTLGALGSRSGAQLQYEQLTIRRKEFAAAVGHLINAEHAHNPRAEMEPFIVLMYCFLDMAVISLLQSHSRLPDGVGGESEHWPYADQHCIYACDNIAAKVN